MRFLALAAICLSTPALADQILASSTISAVTLYPDGAQVTREVVFTAPAGAHEVLITDLPQAIVPELIRLSASEGVALGAFALRSDRLPPREDLTSVALEGAKAAVAAREAEVQAATAALQAVQARVQAADAQVAFLSGVRAEGAGLTPEVLRTLASTIGAEVLAARQAAIAAAQDLPAAEKAVKEAQEALDKARSAQEAVLTGAESYAALSVSLSQATAGEGRLTVQHYVHSAGWQPVYDLMLTRGETPALDLRRGVLVSQSTGEDWQGVALTLSTAQPSQQAAPSAMWSELRRIVDPATEAEQYARAAASEAMADAAPEPVIEPMVAEAAVGYEGDTVVYRYPDAVNVASGVEDLRLALDEKRFAPQVMAWAVPRLDRTAFHMARFVNDSGEPLLPAEAFLYREGVLVGSTWLDGMAPGAEAKIAFGAIEGLQLKRDMPQRSEGDRGLITSSTERTETAVLEVENLTDEAFVVHVEDGVPYSEQEDLEIEVAATPAPSETNVDGRLGVLAWEVNVAPGETAQITLTHTLRWPEGMELR